MNFNCSKSVIVSDLACLLYNKKCVIHNHLKDIAVEEDDSY